MSHYAVKYNRSKFLTFNLLNEDTFISYFKIRYHVSYSWSSVLDKKTAQYFGYYSVLH